MTEIVKADPLQARNSDDAVERLREVVRVNWSPELVGEHQTPLFNHMSAAAMRCSL